MGKDLFNSALNTTGETQTASLSNLIIHNSRNEHHIHNLKEEGTPILDQITKMIDDCDTSTFFVNLDEVLYQYTQWFHYFPRIKPFYGIH